MFRNWKANNAKRADFSGEIIQIPKSKDGYLHQQKDNPAFLEGKSWQDHESTPDNPAQINSIPHDTGIVSCGENLANSNEALVRLATDSVTVYGSKITLNRAESTTQAAYFGVRVKVLPGKTYFYNFTHGQDVDNRRLTIFSQKPDFAYQVEGLVRNLVISTSGSITFEEGESWVVLNGFVGGSTVSGELWLDEIMFSLQDNLYTPYRGSTTHLSLIGAPDTEWAGKEIDLMGLPDGTADYYDQDRQVVVRRADNRVADGSEDGWEIVPYPPMDDYIRFRNSVVITDRILAAGDADGTSGRFLCSRFNPNSASNWLVLEEGFCFYSAGQVLAIKIAKSRLVGYEQSMTDAQIDQLFRDWLSANPVTIQYACEPYEIPVIPQPKIITVDDTIGTVYNLDGAKMNVNAISYGEE